jgi:hypothetical protein
MSRFQSVTDLLWFVETLQEILHKINGVQRRPSEDLTPKLTFLDREAPPFHVMEDRIRSHVPFFLKQLTTIQGHMMDQVGKTEHGVLLTRYQDVLPHLEEKLEKDFGAFWFVYEMSQDILFWHERCLAIMERNGREMADLVEAIGDDSLRPIPYHMSLDQLQEWLQGFRSNEVVISLRRALDQKVSLVDTYKSYRACLSFVRTVGTRLHEQYYALLSLRRLSNAKGVRKI